jgi:hypothetical protein
MRSLIVLIKPVNRPEVAEVPIKGSLIQSGSLSNGRHHDVSAIPGITGDRKAPSPLLGSSRDAQGKRE